MADRMREGSLIHDGSVPYLAGCPRKLDGCAPIARVASEGFESFMCCGETSTAPVATDVLRLCIKSSHQRKPVDLIVNLDRRDAIDVSSVLLGGLSSLAQGDAAAGNDPGSWRCGCGEANSIAYEQCWKCKADAPDCDSRTLTAGRRSEGGGE